MADKLELTPATDAQHVRVDDSIREVDAAHLRDALSCLCGVLLRGEGLEKVIATGPDGTEAEYVLVQIPDRENEDGEPHLVLVNQGHVVVCPART